MSQQNQQNKKINVPSTKKSSVYIAGYDGKLDYGKKYSKITPKSNITLDSLSKILRDPQNWLQYKSLLQYCAYYSHYDNMLSGALYNIFVPFSHQVSYRLSGGDQKIKDDLTEWLNGINFSDILEGMAYDYYTYGRFVSYLYENNTLQLLPVFRCSVENLDILGNPVISYELEKINERSNVDISSLEKKYAGYPPEIVKALKDKKDYALLEHTRTFSCSTPKSAWEKYSIPMIVGSLPYVIKKEVLARTEEVELENMSKSLLEVQVGDKEKINRPSRAELETAAKSYINALKSDGANVASVAWNVKANWLTYTNKECLDSIAKSTSFQNWNILAALSISPVLAAGSQHMVQGGSGSFSQTSVAVDTVNKRINSFLNKVAQVMNRLFLLVVKQKNIDRTKLPKFVFDTVNLSDSNKLKEELIKLYDRGLVSNKSLFSYTDLDYETEKTQRQSENSSGEETIFKPHPTANQMSNSPGAPEKDNTSRTSDKEDSLRSNNTPKPSSE